MVNPSPTHTEIDGDIAKLEDLVTRQKVKQSATVITHGMLLKPDATREFVEEITADATVRPVYLANVTPMNTAGNGDGTVHVVEQGWVLLKTKAILEFDEKVQTHGASKRIMKWAGAAGTDIGDYKGHLNEGDRKFPVTDAAVDDICLIWFYGGREGGDAVV